MKILLINPPHESIGSRIPGEHLPPLGLLCIGGPLEDAGQAVELLDADFDNLPTGEIVARAQAAAPDAILLGHSGSSAADPVVRLLTRALKQALPRTLIIYGGVHPTYFWRDILLDEPQIDIIVRGEGEATAVALINALAAGQPLQGVRGIAFRTKRKVVATAPAPVIECLDDYRVGWNLVDLGRYSYWGGKRAVVIQFSRGCPHLCNYCGQRGFWTRWRHRDPQKLAQEIAWLHREHGVEVFNFADENPSSGRKAWLTFLTALIAEKIEVTLVGSMRAGDIVRDAEHLQLYKRAGFERFLLGMENTDPATLAQIRKGSTTAEDQLAIRLLRRHGILSMATWVTGFGMETDADMWRGLRQIVAYDPDQIQTLYATPLRWTPWFDSVSERRIIQADRKRWDYKHQVLENPNIPAWRMLLWVKAIEAIAQLRPRAMARFLFRRDPKLRHATHWYYRMGRRVWLHEIWAFMARDRRLQNGPTVAQFCGASLARDEQPLALPPARTKPIIEQPRPIAAA